MFDQNGASSAAGGYVDADYASDLDSRRPITGYVFTFGRGPICWKMVLKSTPALSMIEAE